MRLMRPTEEADSISDIDIDALVSSGIRCVLVDRDNTCVPRGQDAPPEEVVSWFSRLADSGVTVCIVSNNFRRGRIRDTADALGCGFVHLAWKPSPLSIRRALATLRHAAEETVMIGDQSYTDVLAGNLAGVRTILVKPQDRDAEPRYTRMLRGIFERDRLL